MGGQEVGHRLFALLGGTGAQQVVDVAEIDHQVEVAFGDLNEVTQPGLPLAEKAGAGHQQAGGALQGHGGLALGFELVEGFA